MILVRNFARRENAVERGCAGFKTEIILIAAIKIDFEIRQGSSSRDAERRIVVPEGSIGRDSECPAQNARTGRSRDAS